MGYIGGFLFWSCVCSSFGTNCLSFALLNLSLQLIDVYADFWANLCSSGACNLKEVLDALW